MLQSILFKNLDGIIDKRIRELVLPKLEPEQGGFVVGRGTTEQSFCIREIFEQHSDKPLFCAFIDIKAAFDRMLRVALWEEFRRLLYLPNSSE